MTTLKSGLKTALPTSAKKALAQISKEYHDEIPLTRIFDVINIAGGTVVQEDGTPWSGIICGAEGSTNFTVTGFKNALHLDWYRMPSGRYEVNVYMF